MIDKTKTKDFEYMEAQRDRGDVYAAKSLERQYRISKDENIQNMRKDLIDAHKRSDVQHSEKIEKSIIEYRDRVYGRSK